MTAPRHPRGQPRPPAMAADDLALARAGVRLVAGRVQIAMAARAC